MRIVIDEDDKMIEGSGPLILEMREAIAATEGHLLPSTSVAYRIFRCPQCEMLVEGHAGEVTVHECDAN